MGVHTKISLEDLKPFFDVDSLQETNHGNTDTVYILNDDYILKIYETNSFENIKAEVEILGLCESLCVPHIKKDCFKIKDKYALIFSRGKGKSLEKANIQHLEQIANFLKKFHLLTKGKKLNIKSSYNNENIKLLIDKTNHQTFKEIYDSLNLKLNDDGIIHGDLFLDNATFLENKLECVFDFSDACNGDFLFDLAVIALSWCEDKKSIEHLLNFYDSSVSLEVFEKYIRYASLYYCVKRYLENRNYEDIIFEKKFKEFIQIGKEIG
ncbi:MAG: hypothetical protein C0625_14845 [Arcobacter sp.]|nr:MAG: hypothetical protein C0625_14845 [Arcobacter sp.]